MSSAPKISEDLIIETPEPKISVKEKPVESKKPVETKKPKYNVETKKAQKLALTAKLSLLAQDKEKGKIPPPV